MNVGANIFLSSIASLNWMVFQIGMSETFPAILNTFFGEILNFLNQDLLSMIPFLNINYTPRDYLIKPYTYQLGFIGLGSQALILNVDTAFWVLLCNILQVFFIFIGYQAIKQRVASPKMRGWFTGKYSETYFNKILEYIDSFELTLVMSAII